MPVENTAGAWEWNRKRLEKAQAEQKARTRAIQERNEQAARDFAAKNRAGDASREIIGRGDPRVDLLAAGVTQRAVKRVDELPGRKGPGAPPVTVQISPGLFSGSFTKEGQAALARGAPVLGRDPVQLVKPKVIPSEPMIHPSKPAPPDANPSSSIPPATTPAPPITTATAGAKKMPFGLGTIIRGGLGVLKDVIPGSLDDAIIDAIVKPTGTAAPQRPTPPTFAPQTGGCPDGSSPPCSVPGDVTPTTVTPGEYSTGARGIMAPILVQRNRLECPKVPGQKQGIVWYSPLTGEHACFPRGVNGAQFGFVRKNKPRPKAYITAHEARMLKKYGKGGTVTKKAKAFAKLAGLHTHAAHRGR